MSKDSKDPTKEAAKVQLEKLQLEALELAEKLGQSVTSENIEAMGLEQITELVADFKSRLADKEAEAARKNAPAAPAASPAVAGGERFYVADGRRSISCKRGVLGPNEEITARDLSNGAEGLAHLVKQGHVVKR